MSGTAQLYRCDGTGRFVAPGRPTLGVPPSFGNYTVKAAVIMGAMATGTNTGLTGPGNLLADKPTPAGGLTPDNATTNLNLTAPTVIDSVDFRSRDVYFRSPGIVVRNCIFRGAGATSNTGMINATNMPVGGDARIIDCLFATAAPSIWYTAVLGHDYTATRCHVLDTVDAFGAYNTATPAGPVNVALYGNWLEALAYISPDPNHPNDKPVSHTHNDFLQIQGGSNIRVVGNAIRALASTSSTITSSTSSPYAPAVSGSGVAITCGVGPVSNVVIDRNLLSGASQPITIITSKGNVASGVAITSNVFDLSQTPALVKANDADSTARKRGILADPSATLVDANGNTVWVPATGQKSVLDTTNGNVQLNSDGTLTPLTISRFTDG